MGKKSNDRHHAKHPFRESDFAGRPAQEQADLSGSLNQLSQQLAATRQLLREIEDRTALYEGEASLPPAPPAAALGQPSDDDTPVAS